MSPAFATEEDGAAIPRRARLGPTISTDRAVNMSIRFSPRPKTVFGLLAAAWSLVMIAVFLARTLDMTRPLAGFLGRSALAALCAYAYLFTGFRIRRGLPRLFPRALDPLEGALIDLALGRAGYRRIAEASVVVLTKLREAGGRLPYHDNSIPEEIRSVFGLSKKAFKQAIGSLYRDRLIRIEPDGIHLVVTLPEG